MSKFSIIFIKYRYYLLCPPHVIKAYDRRKSVLTKNEVKYFQHVNVEYMTDEFDCSDESDGSILSSTKFPGNPKVKSLGYRYFSTSVMLQNSVVR